MPSAKKLRDGAVVRMNGDAMFVNAQIKSAVFMVVGCAALSACASKPPQVLPPAPGPQVAATSGANTFRGPVAGSEDDFRNFTMGADTIHFAYDKYNIDSVSIDALQKQAQWLMRYPAKRATIEGHCDERGTRDYNLALGQRRANAAKDYLVSLGVNASRLGIISYGKERPIDPASNEEAWAKNRRAVTIAVD